MPNTYKASVKVMRSFDYCHFEVNLSSDEELTLEQIDAIRKEAARLADKAVAQYKVAKNNYERVDSAKREVGWRRKEAERIEAIAETDRTDGEKAHLKAFQDACFQASRSYDYEDDWQDHDDEE